MMRRGEYHQTAGAKEKAAEAASILLISPVALPPPIDDHISLRGVHMTKRAERSSFAFPPTNRRLRIRYRRCAKIAERRGWQVVEQYSDAGISGAKGRDGRPGLDQMLK
jgi:hypothetical protein